MRIAVRSFNKHRPSSTAAGDESAPCDGPPVGGRLEGFVLRLRRNERLLDELEMSAARLGRAFAYLEQPDRHRALAEANLARRLARYRTALASLRANQAEARWDLPRPQGPGSSRSSRP